MVFQQEDLEHVSIVLYTNKREITFDKDGRAHLLEPHSGPVTLRLRSTKYHGSSIATHVNDLYEVLSQKDKSSCMILSDGGPDYTPLAL